MIAGITSLTMLVTFIFGYIFIFVTLPMVETKFFPVINQVQVYEATAPDPKVTALTVIGHKDRECTLKSIVGLTSNGDEVPIVSDLKFSPETATMVVRPIGLQSFGIWTFSPKSTHIRVVVRHDCGLPWLSTTEMFQWTKH